MNPVILSETSDYFVVNKPAGMATEPPSDEPTLRDWLITQQLVRPTEWGSDDRFGIIHRLDTDTSGVLLWAKNKKAQDKLRALWQGRVVEKTYLALVVGQTEPNGRIELPIERDNRNDRQRVALLPSDKSRAAITDYKTLAHASVGERVVSLLELHPVTGRTHQIRVHCKAIGHPLVGDQLYGEKASRELALKLGLNRQFLHAWSIQIPEIGKYSAELPNDLRAVLGRLSITATLYTAPKNM
jgi:RluA family pseudouridine synthase